MTAELLVGRKPLDSVPCSETLLDRHAVRAFDYLDASHLVRFKPLDAKPQRKQVFSGQGLW